MASPVVYKGSPLLIPDGNGGFCPAITEKDPCDCCGCTCPCKIPECFCIHEMIVYVHDEAAADGYYQNQGGIFEPPIGTGIYHECRPIQMCADGPSVNCARTWSGTSGYSPDIYAGGGGYSLSVGTDCAHVFDFDELLDHPHPTKPGYRAAEAGDLNGFFTRRYFGLQEPCDICNASCETAINTSGTIGSFTFTMPDGTVVSDWISILPGAFGYYYNGAGNSCFDSYNPLGGSTGWLVSLNVATGVLSIRDILTGITWTAAVNLTTACEGFTSSATSPSSPEPILFEFTPVDSCCYDGLALSLGNPGSRLAKFVKKMGLDGAV